VENRNGALYPGYSLCYRVLRTGSTWTSQVCNGAQAGTPNGGRTLQAISVTLSTPAAIAGNICYADHAGTTGWQNSACDGGYSGGYSGAALVGLYAYKAGGESRGRHVRNVYELSATDVEPSSPTVSRPASLKTWSPRITLAARRHSVSHRSTETSCG